MRTRQFAHSCALALFTICISVLQTDFAGATERKCRSARYDPVLKVDSWKLEQVSAKTVIVLQVTMNADHRAVRDSRNPPSSLTEYNGSIVIGWPEGRHATGVSLSNQNIIAEKPSEIRVTITHPVYAKELLKISKSSLEAWECARSYEYDNGDHVIVN